MAFLREDLQHLFDDQGIDVSRYDERVDFQDPITKYNSLQGRCTHKLTHGVHIVYTCGGECVDFQDPSTKYNSAGYMHRVHISYTQCNACCGVRVTSRTCHQVQPPAGCVGVHVPEK